MRGISKLYNIFDPIPEEWDERRQKSATLLILFALGVFTLTLSEFFGIPSPEIAVGLASSLLTFMLVVLYRQQASIMANQEDLMEREYDSLIVAYVGGTAAFPKLCLRNIGPSAAYDVSASCDLGATEIEMNAPLIPAGEKVGQELPTAPDDYKYSGNPTVVDILAAIDRGDFESEVTVEVSYHNSSHDSRESTWDRDLRDSLNSISEGNHHTPNNQMEELSDQVYTLRKTIEELET